MDSSPGSYDVIDKDRVDASAQGFIRTKTPSDSLNIFTMSPLGRRVDTAAQRSSSSPQMCLANSPTLDIDLECNSVDESFQDNILNHARSSLSTPNSPTSFSFSPILRRGSRDNFDMHYGGSSYGTDMTSLIGSWDSSSVGSLTGTTSSRATNKGKDVARNMVNDHINIEGGVLDSKDKGKGKAVDALPSSGLSHSSSFEFDFELNNVHDIHVNVDSNCKGSYGDIQNALYESPMVCLSPTTGYNFPGQDAGLYAGPSSRNGERIRDVVEGCIVPFGSSPILPHLKSPVSPTPRAPTSMPVTPPLNEPVVPVVPTRVLKHRRSFSSVSLRSIKSSSSRSLASIRSTLTGEPIRGKVRSVAPAAKKLKGSLRTLFSRNAIPRRTLSTTSEFHRDRDDNNGEMVPTNSEQVVPTSSGSSIHDTDTDAEDLYSHDERFDIESDQWGHSLEASAVSEATVKRFSTKKTVPTIQDSKAIEVVMPRIMLESAPSTRCADITGRKCFNQTVSKDVPCPVFETAMTESTNYFDERLPREIRLAVLKSVVDIHESTHQAAISGDSRSNLWSVTTAGRIRWAGREQGMRELVKFSRVSKSWQGLALDGQLWRNLRLTPSPHLSSALLLRVAEHAGPFVQSLDLQGWTHLEPAVLRGLLRSLSFDPASDDPSGALQPTTSLTTLSFPPTNLTVVSLRACLALTAHSLHHVLLRAPSLRSVDLHGLSSVTNSTCGVLSAYCPNLENVDLGRCVNLNGHGIRELIDGVSLTRSWVNEDGASSVIFPRPIKGDSRGSYSKLKILRISGIKGLDTDTLAVLAVGAPALEILDISCSRDLTDDAMYAFVAWDKNWDILPSDSSIDHKPLPNSRKVELTAREMGRDPTIDNGPFYKRVTHLRHLNLSSCSLLTDQACTHLAHCVPHLELLELAGIGPDIGDEGLIRLFKTTPYIRRIDLEDASEITDAVIDALTPKLVTGVPTRRGTPVHPPPQPGHNLQHLVISYGVNITNEALLNLIQACPRLAVLECDNTRVSGVVIKSFINTMWSRNVPSAEIVAVDCRGITEALVKDLAAKGQIRPRKGYRHYDARTLGYVDARDDEDFNNLSTASEGNTVIDDCNDMKVTLKSFWSWQAVNMVQQAREERRIASRRRTTDFGIPGSRQPRELFQDDDSGPSVRPRWFDQWVRGSGTYPSSSATPASLNQDERACIFM